MTNAFRKTDKLFNDRAHRSGLKCGTTALSVLVDLASGCITTASAGMYLPVGVVLLIPNSFR